MEGASQRHADRNMFVSVGGSKLELRTIVSVDQNVNQRIEVNGDFVDDPTREKSKRERTEGPRGSSSSEETARRGYCYSLYSRTQRG